MRVCLCLCEYICVFACFFIFVEKEYLNASIYAADCSSAACVWDLWISATLLLLCSAFIQFFCLCTVCSNCRALLLFFSCTRLLHTYTIVLLPPLLLHNLLLQWYVIDILEQYPFSQFLKQYSYFGFYICVVLNCAVHKVTHAQTLPLSIVFWCI